MAKVHELGYLGVGTEDLLAWKKMASEVFGMQIVPGDTTSTCYLRIDDHHHRIELNEGGPQDVQFVGWEVPDASALEAVAKQLVDGGIDVKAGSRDGADQRRVVEFIKCVDPSGIPTEIFYGHPVNPQPYQPSRAGSGFKTAGEGLGHILVHAPDIDASVRFYRDLLGFRVSDFTTIATPNGPLRLAFLHCNSRHHSIAFIGAPGPKRLNHIMPACDLGRIAVSSFATRCQRPSARASGCSSIWSLSGRFADLPRSARTGHSPLLLSSSNSRLNPVMTRFASRCLR